MTLRALTKVAIAREAAWGTAPADSAFFLVPINPPDVTTEYEQVLDQGLRGIAAKDFNAQIGAGKSSVSLEGLFYPEEIGYFLLGIMGTHTPSGSGTISHTFALDSAPPSLTVYDEPTVRAPGGASEGTAFRYRGCYVSEFTLRFNAAEGAVSWRATLQGMTAQVGTAFGAVPGTIFAGSAPMLGWQGSVQVNGAAYARLVDCEWTFTREVGLVHTLRNTQDPSFGYSSELQVTAKATVEYHTDTDRKYYSDGTVQEFDVTLTRGSGLTTRSIRVNMPSTSWMDSPVEIDRGDNNVKLNWGLRGIYDTTISSPVQVIVVNAKANYNT